MSRPPTSEWNVETLRAYLDARLDALHVLLDERAVASERRVHLAFTASERAMQKAETAIERRLDSVNEFRGALSDATHNNISRVEYDARHQVLEQKIANLGEQLATAEGAGRGAARTVSFLFAALSVLVSIASVVVIIVTR